MTLLEGVIADLSSGNVPDETVRQVASVLWQVKQPVPPPAPEKQKKPRTINPYGTQASLTKYVSQFPPPDGVSAAACVTELRHSGRMRKSDPDSLVDRMFTKNTQTYWPLANGNWTLKKYMRK